MTSHHRQWPSPLRDDRGSTDLFGFGILAALIIGFSVFTLVEKFNEHLNPRSALVDTVPGVDHDALVELCPTGLVPSEFDHHGRTLTVRRVGAVVVDTPTPRGRYGTDGPGKTPAALPVRFDGELETTVLENRAAGDRPQPGERLQICVVDHYGTTRWWPTISSTTLFPTGQTLMLLPWTETGPPVGPFGTARWIADVE